MIKAKADAVLITKPVGTEALYDFQIGTNGDILTEDQLDTSILVSLFTDKRATPSQMVSPLRRRGWVGDLETPGDLYGSHLWLFEQARLTATVLARIGGLTKTCLKWMTRDNIATEVTARATVRTSSVDLLVEIKKPNSPAEAHLFALWENSGKG
tara:strand:- start:232 stop:696 length:465 start_codon:yes stop_codon:yes gene_type:complete